MTKNHILEEIRRTTKENGGKPLGAKRFERQTGIRYGDWFGKYWKGWGDALQRRDSNLILFRAASRMTTCLSST